MPDLSMPIAELVEKIHAANQELSILQRDRDSVQRPGPPCTPEQLGRTRSLFQRFGVEPPATYLTFLQIHNGWMAFSGEANILAIEDHDAPWVQEIRNTYEQFHGPASPFNSMVPVVLTPGSVAQVVFIEPTIAVSEEYPVVVFDHLEEEEEDRFESFGEYFEQHLRALAMAIDAERFGDPVQ